jgi:hypothetical protein
MSPFYMTKTAWDIVVVLIVVLFFVDDAGILEKARIVLGLG